MKNAIILRRGAFFFFCFVFFSFLLFFVLFCFAKITFFNEGNQFGQITGSGTVPNLVQVSILLGCFSYYLHALNIAKIQ